ncbi:DUF6990 domain-containing protein [Stenotrophomonas indicatrix]|uniref:DUF6990 domain-containing protein n=1 Tax=Stenotrophomonas indicatrix TaxID=2045451 RepID=UPI0028AD9A03|nr:hypothetical protein [Stenotrophomonas indicatrix]
MNEKYVVSALKEQGWVCGRDEVGDYFCIMNVGHRQVQVIPYVGKRSDHFRVSLMPSISSEEFSTTVGLILGEGRDHVPVIVSNELPEKLVELSANDVSRLSEKAITWAHAQSLEDGLAAYRNLPTDAKGAMPLRHLAALAIAGEVDRLESYRRHFELGDRLGFVPYITSEMIDRAISIAQKHRA